MEGLSRITRFKLIGLALVAAVALSAVVVASASAALPEIVKPGTATELTKKTIKTKGGASTLETASGTTVTCTGNTAVGRGQGTKQVTKTVVKFTGCKSSGFACQSAGAAANEIVTKEVEGEIGYIFPEANKQVGLDLWPSSRTAMEKTLHEFNAIFVKFTCAGFLNDEVRGSVIARMTPVNKSVKAGSPFTLNYKKGTNPGEQEIQSLKNVEGGVVDVLESKLAGGGFEKANQQGEAEVTFEEDAELRA
ncbi:MAG TPA: hypothetical protein VFY36_01400 [Solirubrobacteraceae bacterium]|nr:hypothetical protein [Solirubrobacteraceae bacterium]